MFIGLVLMLDFVRIVEASISSTLCMKDPRQRRNIMVLSGLGVRRLFIVGLEMVQRCRDMGVTGRGHLFSRRITLAIPEHHAWARTVGNEKLLT